MQLLLFKCAAVFPAKKIVAPVSIGPFGYSWQETVSLRILQQMDTVFIREHVSSALAKKHGLTNSILCADHALMTSKEQTKKKTHSRAHTIVGFTIRQWLPKEAQSDLETSMVEALEKFTRTTGAKIQPIVQVDAPEYGEDDAAATENIVKRLLNKNIAVLPKKTIHSVADALRTYADLDLLLGMRMHSNIFAATQGTPFVAISYEYKTEGIAKQLGMQRYCISCKTVDGNRLTTLLHKVYTNRKQLSRKLGRTIQTIQSIETKRWKKHISL